MVSYTTFTSIAFNVAKQKGAQFENIEEGGQFMSELGELWSENKARYKQMTEAQMRMHLRTKVEA